jgi:hypothetical protein
VNGRDEERRKKERKGCEEKLLFTRLDLELMLI